MTVHLPRINDGCERQKEESRSRAPADCRGRHAAGSARRTTSAPSARRGNITMPSTTKQHIVSLQHAKSDRRCARIPDPPWPFRSAAVAASLQGAIVCELAPVSRSGQNARPGCMWLSGYRLPRHTSPKPAVAPEFTNVAQQGTNASPPASYEADMRAHYSLLFVVQATFGLLTGQSSNWVAAGNRALYQGRPSEAVSDYRRALDAEVRAGGPADTLLHLRVDLATACLETGDIHCAESVLKQADEAGSPAGLSRAELLNAWAAVYTFQGRWSETERDLEQARGILRQVAQPGDPAADCLSQPGRG